jgi:hypothetical protein
VSPSCSHFSTSSPPRVTVPHFAGDQSGGCEVVPHGLFGVHVSDD